MSKVRTTSRWLGSACGAVVLVAGTTFAVDVPRVVVRAGEALSSNPPVTATVVRSVTACGINGYASVVDGNDAGKTTFVWGKLDDEESLVGGLLLSPERQSSPQQARFESQLGLGGRRGDGTYNLLYSTTLADGPRQNATPTQPAVEDRPGFLDSMWMNNQEIALEGLSAPASSFGARWWRFMSRPMLSTTGQAFWIGGTTDVAWNRFRESGVYTGLGSGMKRILGTGDQVGAFGPIIAGTLGVHQYAISPDGRKVMAIVPITGPAATGATAVLSADMTTTTPTLHLHMMEGDLVPSSWEAWNRFRLIALTNVSACPGSGSWYMAAETDGREGSRWVLVKNGQTILYREGQTLDGTTLVGPPLALAVNSTDDVAFVWATTGQAATPRTSLFLNGHRILKLTDTVDTDGDGVADSGQIVTRIQPSIGIGERRADQATNVFVVADVNNTSALVRLRPTTGMAGCCVADVDDGTGTGVRDGGVTIDDLLYYLDRFAEGHISADVDDGTGNGLPDGGVTIDDLLYYLTRYEAGC